jgi:hypothetical protein
MLVGDVVEGAGRDHAGGDEALVQGAHDRAAFAGLDEEGADDRRDDRHTAEHQRVDHAVGTDFGRGQVAEQHGRDHGHRVGLEEIGRHAGAVADVVTDVVGDHGRVARVVFRDTGFDLAHQVGADVGALGEDAAAETGEDGNQRTAEAQADQRRERCFRVAMGEIGVIAGHAEQTQAHHQHAGDGAAAERDLQGGVHALVGGLGGAQVGAHRDVHADVAGGAGQHRAEREADGGQRAQGHPQADEQHRTDDADGGVLTVEIGACALLDGSRDLDHARIALRLGQDPGHGPEAVGHGEHAAGDGEPEWRHERTPQLRMAVN